MIRVTVRQYDSASGDQLGNVSSIDFGSILRNKHSAIKVVDFAVSGAFGISNPRLRVIDAGEIEISSSDEINEDGTAESGNFGIEYSSEFVEKEELTKFFYNIDGDVRFSMKTANITDYVYLSINPGARDVRFGRVSYRFLFDFQDLATPSSSSSSSSSHAGG